MSLAFASGFFVCARYAASLPIPSSAASPPSHPLSGGLS